MSGVEGKSSAGIISLTRSGKEVIALDEEGRLLYFSDGNDTWKRSLHNHYIRIGWSDQKRIIEPLSLQEGNQVYEKAMEFLNSVAKELDEPDLSRKVDYILSKGREWIGKDGQMFSSLYLGQLPLIPQDQRFSIYFQLTFGNSWNCCTFAAPVETLGVRDEAEFMRHVEEVVQLFGKGMSLRRGAFIGDVSVLNSEQKQLLRSMDIVREKTGLPLYTFVDAFSVPKRKNMIHYQDMRRHGLIRAYVGIQSGSVSLLRHFDKLKNVSEILNLVNNLKNSGITVGLILLSGYGGTKFSESHVEETAAIISQMDLDEGDIIYISPMDENADQRYASLVENNVVDVMSQEDKTRQSDILEKRIREEFLGSNRVELKTKISRFDLREAIY